MTTYRGLENLVKITVETATIEKSDGGPHGCIRFDVERLASLFKQANRTADRHNAAVATAYDLMLYWLLHTKDEGAAADECALRARAAAELYQRLERPRTSYRDNGRGGFERIS